MHHASNESGKRHLMDIMELPNQDKIRTLKEKETNKLEGDTIKQEEMKKKLENQKANWDKTR